MKAAGDIPPTLPFPDQYTPGARSTFHALQEWEGYVLEIHGDEFVARLVDLTVGSSHEEEEAATFNRAHVLHRVYDSLREQTFRDFEWLVVDDGSTDGTGALVEAWRAEADFPIRYRYQENRGKHVACNRAVPEARGRFFLTLDSDDACVPQALERLNRYWEEIPEREQPGFSAVTVLCMDEAGRIVGDRFPRRITDSDPLEVQYRLKVRGEKWGFQRTAVMRTKPAAIVASLKPLRPRFCQTVTPSGWRRVAVTPRPCGAGRVHTDRGRARRSDRPNGCGIRRDRSDN